MKEQVTPLNKEEMDSLIEATYDNDFYHMLFYLAKTTGRRLGEFYGVEVKTPIGEKKTGHFKTAYTEEGSLVRIPKKVTVYQKTNEWEYGVKVRDIDFEEGLMKVWVLKRKRYDQDETILTKEGIRLIRRYVMKNKLGMDDYLFRKVSYRQIQNKVKSYAKKAGIKKNVSFHNFRHYFISELSRQGWSHDKIAKLTGHKSINTLKIYDHIVARDLKGEAIAILEEM